MNGHERDDEDARSPVVPAKRTRDLSPAAQKPRNRGALRGRGNAGERASRETYEDPCGGAHLMKAREALLDKRDVEVRGHRHAESRQPPDPAARLDRE